MPRVKLTRTIAFLFMVTSLSFIAFNVWIEMGRVKENKQHNNLNVLQGGLNDEAGRQRSRGVDKTGMSRAEEGLMGKSNKQIIDNDVGIKESAASYSKGNAGVKKRSGRDEDGDGEKGENFSWNNLWKSMRGRPWFMRNGSIRPSGDIRPDFPPPPPDRLPLWPLRQPNSVTDFDADPASDRIVNQLMYFPPNNGVPKEKLKKIVLFFGRGGWSAKDLPMGRTKFLMDKCPVNTCELSMDLNDAEKAEAIFFKDRFQWPKHRRHPNQVWILFLLECPAHTQSFRGLSHVFNWTATYRHDSDIVAPYEKFVSFPDEDMKPSTRDYSAGKTKKVAWFVSNCGAKNRRLEYARELSRHIDVDIYGGCGKKRCPRSRPRQCFDLLNKEYKFYLAFENSNCRDYITEKFFVNGLANDILPIVMGAHPIDYKRNSPPNSYLHVDQFAAPSELAEYLHELDRNDTLYNNYFKWKGTGEFVNTYFWCRLCAALHSPQRGTSYPDIHEWWAGQSVCSNTGWNNR